MKARLLALATLCIVLSLAFSVSALVKHQEIANAATTTLPFSSTWVAKKMVSVKVPGNSTAKISLGVSEWSVTGTSGSYSFTETWTATAYNYLYDSTVMAGCPRTAADYITNDDYANGESSQENGANRIAPPNTSGQGLHSLFTIYGSPVVKGVGQYGWICMAYPRSGLDTNDVSTGSAIPTRWEVSGLISAP